MTAPLRFKRRASPRALPSRPTTLFREDCMKITFGEPALPKTGAVVVGVKEEGKLTPTAAELDRRTGGALKRAIAASRFSGKKDELLSVVAPANLVLSRIVLPGLGQPSSV